ncbi:phage tail tape measure protein [Brucella intermedia]|uniref:phage tail tape measure protein n=1 Tax=Brucella intermedia TaxID=94625 RepID=UPI00165CF619|nr:phage tail tape measure protein [Brucella intermedia]QNQ40579.1 tail tape measure protein [Brucella intermedia]
MADDTERLFVALEARVNNFEKEFKRAERTGTRTYQSLQRNSSRATRQMEQDATRSAARINQAFATIGTKIGGYSKAFGLGLAGGVATAGLGVLAASVKGVTSSFAELGREAKTAGISVEDFQRWRYVADQNKIGIDALIDGFKELNLRADEYIQTGKGSAAESFQRLGMSPADVKERIKDPSKFMLELIERTRQLKDTAAGVRIFDELLGGQGGEQFVRLIEQGRAGISATIEEANKMSAVFDQGWIERAEEVDKKFNKISTTVGTVLKGAIVDAAQALFDFIDSFNQFENQTRRTLQNRQTAIMGEKNALAAEIREAETERDEMTRSGGGSPGILSGQIGELKQRMDALNAEEDKIIAVLSQRTEDEAKANKDLRPTFQPYVPPETKKGSAKKTTEEREREKAAKAADREREAVKKLISDLEFEASLVGKSAVEKAKMTAVRQAGAAATETEKQKIEALVESTYKQNEAWQKSQDQLAELNDMGREFAGTLVSGLLSGADASDVLADALGRLADRFLNSGLDALFGGGGGGIGGLLGGLFGGGSSFFPSAPGIGLYARGSTFTPEGAAIVGEQGPELVHLPRGSKVTPNHMLGQSGQGGKSQRVSVQSDVRVSFDNDGNFKAYVTNQSAQVAQQAVKQFANSSEFKMKAWEQANNRVKSPRLRSW